jgi:hypothetical protein
VIYQPKSFIIPRESTPRRSKPSTDFSELSQLFTLVIIKGVSGKGGLRGKQTAPSYLLGEEGRMRRTRATQSHSPTPEFEGLHDKASKSEERHLEKIAET